MTKWFKKFVMFSFLLIVLLPIAVFSESAVYYDGPSLLPTAEIILEPHSGDFLVGSTFDVPIYINTKGSSINAVNVKLSFDASKLSIVKPSGGRSILGIWLEPPSYDNKNGTASFVGVIPNGIVTSSGLIATVTFKALAPGEAKIELTDYSSANLNDGVGSMAKLSLDRVIYRINPKTPEGVKIYSETHPLQGHWYNNNSPILNWDRPDNLDGYSVAMDLNPNTIPEAKVNFNSSMASYENLKDGIWYLHVRSRINGIWGNVSHFEIRIDTNSPAFFSGEVSVIRNDNKTKKYLISFYTTDSLSGIDHYEIGIIDKREENTSSPVFIQTDSPYIVPNIETNKHVIIRAFDKAMNVREVSLNLYKGITLVAKIKQYALYLLIIITLILFLELVLHYLFGHHILDHLRRALAIFRKIQNDENKYKEIEKEIEEVDQKNTQISEKNDDKSLSL